MSMYKSDNYDNNGDAHSVDYEKHDGGVKSDDENDEQINKMAEKANEYIKDLLGEKVQIDRKFPHADRLLDQGKNRACPGGRK